MIERDAEPPACPACGEIYEPGQQYCLECGAPLPRPAAATGRPPLWAWALGALAIVIAGAVIGLVAASDDEAQSTTVASPAVTTASEAASPETEPPTVETTPVTEEIVPPAATEPPASETPLEWPAGTSGYTVILASIPSARGRGEADARAESALAAGLSEVGVLDSASYSSLRPGYWVVFTGVHSTLEEARGALPSARSAGFADAYTRRVE